MDVADVPGLVDIPCFMHDYHLYQYDLIMIYK